MYILIHLRTIIISYLHINTYPRGGRGPRSPWPRRRPAASPRPRTRRPGGRSPQSTVGWCDRLIWLYEEDTTHVPWVPCNPTSVLPYLLHRQLQQLPPPDGVGPLDGARGGEGVAGAAPPLVLWGGHLACAWLHGCMHGRRNGAAWLDDDTPLPHIFTSNRPPLPPPLNTPKKNSPIATQSTDSGTSVAPSSSVITPPRSSPRRRRSSAVTICGAAAPEDDDEGGLRRHPRYYGGLGV